MLVTCALPYANGPIHIGHLLEHIQADILVRYQRMLGHEVWFICADDSHGTPIILKSRELYIHPKKLISKMFQNHICDLKCFNISYDNYSSTHHSINLYFLKKLYYTLKLNNLITLKKVIQLYDVKENIFLPDRFVQGICPNCYAKDQYGDHCELCNSVYKTIELINPVSKISNTEPVLRNSMHIFFDIAVLQNTLYEWMQTGVLHKHIVNKMKEWFYKSLKSWNISRDKPYFGFRIPDFKNKYFYVWMDAPIAYISTFKNLCYNNPLINFHEFWNINSSTELYHFIGKDIVYFHILFWPAMLESMKFRKPTKIFVHGHVKIKGMKISKSKGYVITVKKWLKYFDSDSLRYYYASKLSSKIEDIDFNVQDFIYKINSDLVNKIVNLASRSSSFLNKYFDNMLSKKLDNIKLYTQFVSVSHKIKYFFQDLDFNLVIKEVIKLSEIANQYFNHNKPWKILDPKNSIKLQEICSTAINLFRIIMIYLKPIVPNLVNKSEKFLLTILDWNNIHIPLLNHRISIFKTLYARIDTTNIDDLFK
ncbi:methionine--tRNA ligase [Buchnera aphidicola]|uniref:methionine--tRNA ligase n=1 Tax=Buchnera aphidicola TaxID=9 RepID=UPI003463E572